MRASTLVHLEWQGSQRCGNASIKIRDDRAVFRYRQNGRAKLSVLPMIRVRVHANDAVWDGVARANDLRAAGLLHRLEIGKFTFCDRTALQLEMTA